MDFAGCNWDKLQGEILEGNVADVISTLQYADKCDSSSCTHDEYVIDLILLLKVGGHGW